MNTSSASNCGRLQDVTIWAMKDVRELAASSDALEGSARSARCAAFATAAACIAATQDKEALFANPLKMPSKAADPTGLLYQKPPRPCSRCIDACAQYFSCLAVCEVMRQPNLSHMTLPPHGQVTCRSMAKAARCGQDSQVACRS